MSGQSITVASGKGGVGKTCLAIALSHALARAGERVLLIDADLGLANVDIQLGLLPPHDLGDVLAGRHTLAEAVCHHASGFDILAGRSGSGELAGLGGGGWARLRGCVAEAKRLYRHVVLDLPAGLDLFTRQTAAAADRLLVVVTEEPTSLTDAYAVLKLHRQDRAPDRRTASVVVNQASSAAAARHVHATLARACQSFLGESPPLLGIVPRDANLRDAIRRQTPLLQRHPNTAAAQAIEALAREFVSTPALHTQL
jgi:flagellar biosynthesis protein FlhG